LDSGGDELTFVLSNIESPLHRTESGTGDFVNCIGPDQVGITGDVALSSALDIAEVASLEFALEGLLMDDAVPAADIAVSGLTVTERFGSNAFSGTLHNDSSETVEDPRVTVFSLNDVGRPLGSGMAIELISMSPGGTWAFETTTVDDVGTDWVAFPQVDLPY
jgi:hypothetical protein